MCGWLDEVAEDVIPAHPLRADLISETYAPRRNLYLNPVS